ncbi:FHA domain-containing protein [Roseibacillus ishigakijimensis]|uniref:FHA domain-containing protein n=1 Tax=Roseibacillus ishigakijimensis TaxID=454146 RepID=A0A934RVM2_9BACT|nr:FHA domain-containing protein [Roseibacillus ishigakijimensis]MBK1835281.1 FHA domain-containing protein [Roseibacillus ishigakijimensis]
MPRICLTSPDQAPQPFRFPLDTSLVTIGRRAELDVVLTHPSVSSHHCDMKRVPGGFVLEDHQSTNGTLLNGQEMAVIDLKDGLELEIGDVHFRYELTEEEKAALAQESFRPQQRAKNPAPAASPAPAPAPGAPAPYRPVTSLPRRRDTGGRDFAIFLAFAALAIFAFYLGLNSAHRATIPFDERVGRSLLKDMRAEPLPESTPES